MKKKELAKTIEEFDRRFDEGEDVTDLIDTSKAVITRGSKKVRLTSADWLRILKKSHHG